MARSEEALDVGGEAVAEVVDVEAHVADPVVDAAEPASLVGVEVGAHRRVDVGGERLIGQLEDVPRRREFVGHEVVEALLDVRTSINLGAAVPNADGTVTIVISHDRLAHPNAVSTAGRDDGALAFRWFLADSVPTRPTVEVVDAADAPTVPS